MVHWVLTHSLFQPRPIFPFSGDGHELGPREPVCEQFMVMDHEPLGHGS